MRVAVEINNRMPQVTDAMRRAAERIVRETTLRVEANIKSGMASPHSGALYGTHQASAPGEFPAIDTGALVNSIQTEMQGLQGIVYTNQEYAVYLEYGTIRMSPRPFMIPATERERPEFERRMGNLESEL